MIPGDYTNNGFQQFVAKKPLRIADKQIQGLTPTSNDVICGRGKKVFEHEGNVNFRSIVMAKLPDYKAAVSKAQKSAVVSSVFDEVTIDGNFIKQNAQTEKWYVVSEAAAREKISQCFRDCLHDKLDSKNCKAKKRKQTSELAEVKRVPEVESLPPAPKRTKLSRAHTAPSTFAYSSSDAFQQLVMFSRSVMPPPCRSNSLPPSNPSSATWFEDMEPLSVSSIEPISFPSMPSISLYPDDWEPTPLSFRGNAGHE